ncbi:hypothetical protein GWI33_015626 [Rhynchophorus ferrugineus]|uniref:Uncharacterized protein n=1 Tax=Rhynchophorus ferrugineus TaxID=354439 RepID=A0A834ICW9_RHYFE|nr:hypothetical protein GWI33_015626 [Rhynchophorus ferrugineus]
MPHSRNKNRLTLTSHQEKKPKLTGPNVTDNDAINPPRKNQPLSRPWLTSTPSTSKAAKPANFKTPKQPVPKPSTETTESIVNAHKRHFPDKKSTNTSTETPISNSNATTSPSTSTQSLPPPQSKSNIPPVVLCHQRYFTELRRITNQHGIQIGITQTKKESACFYPPTQMDLRISVR